MKKSPHEYVEINSKRRRTHQIESDAMNVAAGRTPRHHSASPTPTAACTLGRARAKGAYFRSRSDQPGGSTTGIDGSGLTDFIFLRKALNDHPIKYIVRKLNGIVVQALFSQESTGTYFIIKIINPVSPKKRMAGKTAS